MSRNRSGDRNRGSVGRKGGNVGPKEVGKYWQEGNVNRKCVQERRKCGQEVREYGQERRSMGRKGGSMDTMGGGMAQKEM